MDQKRAKKNRQMNRITRLKRRRRKIRNIFLVVTISFILVISGIIINKVYVSNKCKSLEYAVDHYFTTWNDKDLRLASVQTMSLIDKNTTTVTVEAFGLSYKEPRQSTTLIGNFIKNENGSWKMTSVENKASLPSTE